jgi:hypothetical protein
MRHLALAIALLALPFPAFADDAADTGPIKLSPQQIGDIFCITRVGNDMAPVEAIITASLKKAIAKADALDAAWGKKNPGEKPPLGDGIPWQSSPDYAPKCMADHASLEMDEARVSINYTFPDDAGANFTDVLHLKLVPDPIMGDKIWRIDDVTFPDKTSMRQELIDAFKP